MHQNYDLTYIGTGPVNMLNCLIQLEKTPDKKILFVDSKNQIGGAWHFKKSKYDYDIECGCHIWSYCPEVYKYISEKLCIPLNKVPRSPTLRYKNINLTYSLKYSFDIFKALFKNLFSFNFKRLYKVLQRPNFYFFHFNKSHQYPQKGSPEFIKRLYERITAFPNVTFLMNEHTRSIDVNNDVVRLKFDDIVISTKILYLTSTSNIDEIKTPYKKIQIEKIKKQYIHFLIEPNKNSNSNRYLRILNDKIIHRITDISYQTDYTKSLLLIGIKENAYNTHKKNELIDYIKQYIKKNTLIKNNASIDLIETNVFEVHYIPEHQRNQLNTLDKKIILSHSTDLMYGFYHLLKKEKKI